MRFINFSILFFIAISSVSCAYAPNETLTKREKWRKMEAKPGAMTASATSKQGRTVEMVMTVEVDLEVEKVVSQSESARQCENFARNKPAKMEWLSFCDAALAEEALSLGNRKATLFNKALIVDTLGQSQKAQTLFLDLVKTYPDFAEPEFELARLAYYADDCSTAIEYANRAIEKSVRKPDLAYNLIGWCHEERFDFPAARAAYETALIKSPGNAESKRYLKRLNKLWPEKTALVRP